MAIDIKLIPYIEKALGIKLYDEQIQYLTKEGYYTWVGGRRSGLTTANIIWLALSKGDPIRRSEFRFMTDRSSSEELYTQWFFREFMKIREKLKQAGFQVREIKLNK